MLIVIIYHHVVMSFYYVQKKLLHFQIKFKSLIIYDPHKSTRFYFCSSSTGYKSENTSFRVPQGREG